MENIIGMKFNIEITPQNIAIGSEISACCCGCLMKNYPVTYSQILYPYADALSLSGKKGTESTRIFGTHILFHNIDIESLNCAVDFGIKFVAEKLGLDETNLRANFIVEFKKFNLIDCCATSADICKFLNIECNDIATVGDYSTLLSGFVPHWRIREMSRIFASFAEMAYRRSNGAVCGLAGGKLALNEKCDCIDALKDIFHQKTGS